MSEVIEGTGGHVESRDCWCEPEVSQLCPQCDGDEPSCWRCGGEGWVEFYDEHLDAIIVHTDARLPGYD